MSDETDISAEAVERLAVYAEGRGEIEEALAFRALRAALDARDEMLTDMHDSREDMRAERDAALAARDAAWRQGVEAAAKVEDEEAAHIGGWITSAAQAFAGDDGIDDVIADARENQRSAERRAAAIRALQPPADLAAQAAQAPGDAVR